MQKTQEIPIIEKPEPPDEVLLSRDVMARLRISRRTLERYVDSGKLPVSYLPSGHRRYSAAAVEQMLTDSRAIHAA